MRLLRFVIPKGPQPLMNLLLYRTDPPPANSRFLPSVGMTKMGMRKIEMTKMGMTKVGITETGLTLPPNAHSLSWMLILNR